MHETGVMMEIIDIASKYARKSGARKIYKIVLQVGQLSALEPEYAKICYPLAAEGTMAEGSEVEFEMIPALAVCQQCGKTYNVVENEFECPNCNSSEREIISGKELKIKELHAM